MTVLPILARELVVAARKRATFWLRVGAALAGMVVAGCCLILLSAMSSGSTAVGSFLFWALSWLSAATVLCAGFFFSSDCLSEERREGTLGLLFLTDLRGYDVAGGKLLANSLRAFYGLLALFPIMGLTLLMGGVTGEQFGKTCLALVNALFVSLTAGLVVSAFSRDSQKALAGTFFLMLALTLGGPLLDATISGLRKGPFHTLFSFASPGYLLVTARQWGRTAYWLTLGVNQVIAWMFFALACLRVPRAWQEKIGRAETAANNRSYAWKYGGARRRARLRRKLLERDPVRWLVCRERWQSAALWLIVVLLAGCFALMTGTQQREFWMLWSYLGAIVSFGLYLWVASQAGRFFIEARRTGLTELLLVAPLESGALVRGHWRALLGLFGVQLALLLCLQAAASSLSQSAWRRVAVQAQTAATMAAATNANSRVTLQTNSAVIAGSTNSTTVSYSFSVTAAAPSPPRIAFADLLSWPDLVLTILVVASTAANFMALAWFGTWMGMTSRTASLATLKTVAFVQVIPGLVFYFCSMMLTLVVLIPNLSSSATGGAGMIAWFPLLTGAISALLALGKDVCFIAWSRRRLDSAFRDQASNVLAYSNAAPPPLPHRAAPPPIIQVQS
jgi:hypothetical protein